MADVFKLVSLNVKGISNFKKRRTMFTWCRKRKADIIFLQETHSTIKTDTQWKNEWGAEIITCHGSSNSRGVAILFKNGFDCTIHQRILDPLGRYLILKIDIKDKTYVIINVYAPNKDKDLISFFNNLLATLQKENLESEDNIIIGGDFNCPLNPDVDKKGGILFKRKSVTACIECLQSQLDLVDIWRIKNPDTKSFTWSQKSPRIFCRLDYWLVSNNLNDLVKSTDIIPAIRTDHDAISIEIGKIENELKGPGYWKMNCSLLTDEEYVNNVTAMIPIWTADGRKELSDNRSVWDWIKYNIRSHAIHFSRKRAKEKNEKETTLQDEFRKAKQEFEMIPSDSNASRHNEAQEKLETFYEEKTKGIIIRARARWHEHGEKSTKYFLNLEKRNHIKKHIRKLHISGVIKTDPFCILNEQERFYRDLFKSSYNDPGIALNMSSFLSDLNIPILSEDQKSSCEGKISSEECFQLLDSFHNNKTPGNDGIPIEFYKQFWSVISDSFISCVNECFEKGEMSSSQKQAVITLIEKKGKDRSLLENWRPISLVNVDTKIMTKVIAWRIKNVLPDIIHHNQTGYVKDRFIGETIRSIYDIMDFTVKENIPGLMVFIDFQKAFDSVEWKFLFKCLEVFNFGPDFLRWVKVFYKNIQSCIMNNGMTSNYFTLERGVRQGDPLSPYLFIVVVETLAIAIRQNPAIKGIFIGKEETKLLQYADDTTAVLADTNSAKTLFKLLDLFKNISGLKINCSKTEGLWIGSLKGSKDKPFGIKWPKVPIKALGVYFTYDQKLLKEKNFIERLDSIKKLINIWSSRGLSIYGKVTIIKSFLIPKFVYICSLLPTPKEVVKELNQLLFKFLWKGTDKVTRASVINVYEEGGLKMIDMDCMIKSLRLAWLKRLLNGSNATWKRYLIYQLEPLGGLFFLNCNYDVDDYTISSQFYYELLLWWSEFRKSFASESDYQNIIWNNKEIRIDKKPVYYKNYFESGVIYTQDLLFDLNITASFGHFSDKINKINFLQWAGLRYSIPSYLKVDNLTTSTVSPSFLIGNNIFDVKKKKSKDYYSLLVSKKAQPPKIIHKLQSDFDFTIDQFRQIFTLPHSVALESYVKAFQYKVIHSILYTNTKLCKIGYISNDLCTFCDAKPENLYHLFYECSHSKQFWNDFESYWYLLSNQIIDLSLQNVLFGIISKQCPLSNLLNYFIIIGKLFL